jgi:hypothetical protein
MVETHVLEGRPSDLQKQEFAEMLTAKIAQGYEVESQSDTEAVLVTRGRRRRFRQTVGGKRQRVSIDGQCRLSTRGL